MAEIQEQLSRLLGREVKQLRITDDDPPYISVVDVAAVITGKNHDAAAQDFRRMSERYPDVSAKCTDVKFVDSRGRRGQRNTKAKDVRGIVEIVMVLPGRVAARGTSAECGINTPRWERFVPTSVFSRLGPAKYASDWREGHRRDRHASSR